MPAPAAEPAPPRTELQELQLKATEKTDEVSNRLRALLRLKANDEQSISVLRVHPSYVGVMRRGENRFHIDVQCY